MTTSSIYRTEGNEAPNASNVTKQPASQSELNSWYSSMARAWGSALDEQAAKITDLSDQIGDVGNDRPAVMVQLTAESMRMQFMSNNSSTANNSVGQALETLARRQ